MHSIQINQQLVIATKHAEKPNNVLLPLYDKKMRVVFKINKHLITHSEESKSQQVSTSPKAHPCWPAQPGAITIKEYGPMEPARAAKVTDRAGPVERRQHHHETLHLVKLPSVQILDVAWSLRACPCILSSS